MYKIILFGNRLNTHQNLSIALALRFKILLVSKNIPKGYHPDYWTGRLLNSPQKIPLSFGEAGFLIALHHLFSFVGLKNECRNRMKRSESDDAIVSKKI